MLLEADRPGALFSVLGPLEMRAGTTSTDLSGKPAALLSLLLLHANTWVGTDEIIEALWARSAPASANRNIKTYIWQLRRWLPAANGEPRVQGRRGGYRIVVGEGELDAQILDATVQDSRADRNAAQVADRLAAALQLWRGTPYPELSPDITRIAVARLEQLRWELRDRYAAALIDCGRNLDAVALLRPLIVEDPLREDLWLRLIWAWYGLGHRSEALATYQSARRHLLDELGVEPGPALQQAQRQVLRGEPTRAAATPARPACLPRAVPDFVGRADELRAVTAGPEAGRIVLIDGLPGSGKTTLAVHAAHRLADRYPDGQVFCDLHGRGTAADPAAVLAGLLRAFGVEPVPAPLEERAALWRSTLAGRRVLIVLDDAAGPAQLRPLLPGGGEHLVLVTSQRRLAEPDGVRAVTLGPLGHRESLELIGAVAGAHRVRREPAAAAAIVQHCGGLPVALRIAAGRLHRHPGSSVAALARRLGDDDTRLAELSTSDRDLAAMFSAPYGRLRPVEQETFRKLGGAGALDTAAIATLAGLSTMEAERVVERLLDDHLLIQCGRDRYRIPEPLRAYARQLVPDLTIRRTA